MTSDTYIKHATTLLTNAGIQTARLDTLVLMEFALGIDRSKLLANPDLIITPDQQKLLNGILKKRTKHIPISYIVQGSEFYGRKFYINNYVLEPRPESETMIDQFKHILVNDPALQKRTYIKVADVGTGSGALGITAALESNNIHLDLIDIDQNALNVAKQNVVLHTITANVIHANLLPNNNLAYDILLCNLPYVPDDFTINLAANHEPRIAIFGGKDGLDIYRKLFKLVSYRQRNPLYILTESLPTSHEELSNIAREYNYRLKQTEDFIQVFKLVQ